MLGSLFVQFLDWLVSLMPLTSLISRMTCAISSRLVGVGQCLSSCSSMVWGKPERGRLEE